jgi:hypothetical protein
MSNELSRRGIRPNRLMFAEVIPTSADVALVDLVPEFGDPGSVVITQEIAQVLIDQLQKFRTMALGAPLAMKRN